MRTFILMISSILLTECQWIKEMEESGNFEGDMILSPSQMYDVTHGNAYATTIGRQWPNAIVYYEMDSDIAGQAVARSVINTAIKEYEQKTCIRFKKRTSEKEYIKFYIGPGCSSYVGFNGGKGWPMLVSLARGCWTRGTVVHEIGHALGMFHEQSRPDRDNHVTINWNNIEEKNKFNFMKQPSNNIDSLGVRYDYLSVMHYSKDAFGKLQNGIRKTTIVTKEKSFQDRIGKSRGLSELDVEQFNKLYRCKGTRPPIETRPPPTQPPNCKDGNPSCSGWRSICKTHFNIASLCRKTCGLC